MADIYVMPMTCVFFERGEHTVSFVYHNRSHIVVMATDLPSDTVHKPAPLVAAQLMSMGYKETDRREVVI